MDSTDIRIYTDGSTTDSKVGAAAVMYCARGNPVKILRYKLGLSSKYSTKDAEAVGCILALWLLKDENQLSHTATSIYMDSQSFIQSIGARRAKSGSCYDFDRFSLLQT